MIKYLVKMLNRTNVELLILTCHFLKKLSIYKENIQEMLKMNILNQMPKISIKTDIALLEAMMRLLHNLSFDKTARESMIKLAFLQKVSQTV